MDYIDDGIGTSNIIIYTTEDGLSKIETTFDGDTVWLSKNQMAELFQRDCSVISKHIKNIFEEGELLREGNVQILHVANSDRPVEFYNLDVIISVGYRVKSKRGTQFRIWATGILKKYMRKGFALDDERLKNLGGGRYFKELLERICDICASEKVLYRQILEKMTVCLLLVSLLLGCGQSEGNIENERPDESSKQADEAVQTEEGEIFDDSIIFTDATMEEIISEACKGKPDKEHLEAITVLRFSLTKEEEPIVVLDDLALLSNLEQLYIDVQPECEKQMVLDYGYLENMEELEELTIHDEHLTDISFIKQMKTLQRLDVSDCSIKDISHLLSCSGLRNLNLSNNEIEDYTGIEYLSELDNLIIGGNPGDPLQVLRKRAVDVFTTSDEEREAWKDELKKAFDVYDPLIEKSDEFNSETEDWCVGDFNWDGIDDLGVVVGRTDEKIASVPIQRRLYLYLGNEEGYEEPLNPLPLRSGYGNENSFQGFTMRDGKIFAKYCFDSQDTLLTDMEIYEYRDEEWQYVLYTSDQKQSTGKESQEAADSIIRRVNCFGVYDFENDSFTVYTWRYATDDKGEYVKRWGHSLSDVFLYYDRIRYDEGEDGYKWISIVNPYYLYPDVSLETVKGERKEISENENAISTRQALDMIYEQYYGTYSCDKIFFDEDVLAVYEDVLGCEMPEYAYRIEIDGIPYFLHLSQVDETVYEFYTYGFDYDKKEMVRVDTFQVNYLTGVIDAYLDI